MLENRPIVTIMVGYIIGIIMGLYCKISIVFLYGILLIVYLIYKKIYKRKTKFKLISFKRYFRYLKLVMTRKVILIIVIVSIISNFKIIYNNKKFQEVYDTLGNQSISSTAIIVSNIKEKEYKNTYKIKIENKYFYLNLDKNKEEFKYGNMVDIEGVYNLPKTRTNYKGFDYREYLKTKKICGTIECENITLVGEKRGLMINIFKKSNLILLKIKSKIQKKFDEETANILLGVLLGYTDEIDEDIREDFVESNISYILAISGMHVAYLSLCVQILFKNILGKRKTEVLTVIILIIYVFITGFSPSVVRASIMAILVIGGDIFYRKSDVWQNISLALLLLLIYNPFLIKNTSLLLSFIATMGILFGQSIKNIKYVSVTIYATLAILPVMAIIYNKIAILSLIISIIVGIIIAPIVIGGFIFILTNWIINITILNKILEIFVKVVIKIAQIGSEIPLNTIYAITPNWVEIWVYYCILILIFFLWKIYHLRRDGMFSKRIKNLVNLFKFRFNQNKNRIFSLFCIVLVLFCFLKIIPKDLKIYFIDVGQGDSTLIITPKNKKILLDGGGSEFGSFNVGENTLLPYLLDRRIKSLDYVIFSHFDADHCDGLLTVIQKLRVKTVVIGKQYEISNNYKKFLDIVNNKKINIIVLESGDKLKIEKNIYFDVLWPSTVNVIRENILNNNSLVCKLSYKDFSMLFTGDIEEIAEKEIATKYNEILNSLILKVAHHR